MRPEEDYEVPREVQHEQERPYCCHIHRISSRRVTWILIVPATILLCLGCIIILCTTVRVLYHNTTRHTQQQQSYHVIGAAFLAFGLGLAIIAYVLYRRVGDNQVRPLASDRPTMYNLDTSSSESPNISQSDQETTDHGRESSAHVDFSNSLSSQSRSCLREFYSACCTLPIQVTQVPPVVPNIPYRSSMEITNDGPPSRSSSSSLTSNENVTPRQLTTVAREDKINNDNSPINNKPCNVDRGRTMNEYYDDSSTAVQPEPMSSSSSQRLLENYNSNNSTKTNNEIIVLSNTVYNNCDFIESPDSNQAKINVKKQTDCDNLSLDNSLGTCSSLCSSTAAVSTVVTTHADHDNTSARNGVRLVNLVKNNHNVTTLGNDGQVVNLVQSDHTINTLGNDMEVLNLVQKEDRVSTMGNVIEVVNAVRNDHRVYTMNLIQNGHRINTLGNDVEVVNIVQNETPGNDMEIVNKVKNEHRVNPPGNVIEAVQNDHSVNILGNDTEVMNLVQNDHKVNTPGDDVALVNIVQNEHRVNTLGTDMEVVNLVQNGHLLNTPGNDIDVQNDHSVNGDGNYFQLTNPGQTNHNTNTLEQPHVHLVNSVENGRNIKENCVVVVIPTHDRCNERESIPSNELTVRAVTDQLENASSSVKCLSSHSPSKTTEIEGPTCKAEIGIDHTECTQSQADKPVLERVSPDFFSLSPNNLTSSFLNTTDCSCGSSESDLHVTYRENMIKDAIQEKVSSVLSPDFKQVLSREISAKDFKNKGQIRFEHVQNCDQTVKGASSDRSEINVPERLPCIDQPCNKQPSPANNQIPNKTTKNLNESSPSVWWAVQESDAPESDVLVSEDTHNQTGTADTTLDYMSAQEDLSIYSDTDHSFYSVNSTITSDMTITVDSEEDEYSTLINTKIMRSNHDNWTCKSDDLMGQESLENVNFYQEPLTSTPRSSPVK